MLAKEALLVLSLGAFAAFAQPGAHVVGRHP